MSAAYDPYPYQRTYLILRERHPDVWVLLGEETIFSNKPITDAKKNGSLAVRAFLTRSNNGGGKFSVVPKDVWERINGTKSSPEAVPA